MKKLRVTLFLTASSSLKTEHVDHIKKRIALVFSLYPQLQALVT